MKGKARITHRTAFCSECGLISDDYVTAMEEGRKHAKKTGHEVIVETGHSIRYNAK